MSHKFASHWVSVHTHILMSERKGNTKKRKNENLLVVQHNREKTLDFSGDFLHTFLNFIIYINYFDFLIPPANSLTYFGRFSFNWHPIKCNFYVSYLVTKLRGPFILIGRECMLLSNVCLRTLFWAKKCTVCLR